MFKLLLVTSLSFLFWGCATPQPQSYFSQQIDCPIEKIKISNIGDKKTKKVEGCGKTKTFTHYWHDYYGNQWVSMPDLKTRASFDLNCDKESLVVSLLSGSRQQGARGCGKSAVYNFVQTGQNNWAWIMDATSSVKR